MFLTELTAVLFEKLCEDVEFLCSSELSVVLSDGLFEKIGRKSQMENKAELR